MNNNKIPPQQNVVKVESIGNNVVVYYRDGMEKKKRFYNLQNFYYKLDESGTYETVFGSKCKKVFYNGKPPRDSNLLETDIKLHEHFAIELFRRGMFSRPKEYRVLHFDLETNGSIDTENTPAEIISITTWDSFKKEYLFWAILSGSEKDNAFMAVQKDILNCKVYKNEKDMLQDFMDYLKDFDIATAFNSNKFDNPYLVNRSKKLGVKSASCCNFFDGSKQWGGKSSRTTIRGVNLVDLMVVFMKVVEWLPTKPPDYRLDTIAKTFLNQTRKIELSVTPGELWKTGRYRELMEYNIMDVQVMVELDKKFGLIQFVQNTQELVPALDVDCVPYNSKIIDNYLMSKHKKVFPSKNFERDKTFVVTGATVLEPIPGFHNNVGIFDFSGMYQNIIRTFNISPDTIDPKGETKIGEVNFTTKKYGLLNNLVSDFIKNRDEIKKIKKSYVGKDDDMVNIYFYKECMIKKVTNSVYGVFAYSGFRLYDPRVANAITWVGRKLIDYINEMSQKHGFVVVYGDTDSVFIKKPELNNCKDITKISKVMEDFNGVLNHGLTGFVSNLTTDKKLIENHTLNIEFETLFKEMCMTNAKKRYTGYVTRWKNETLNKPRLYYHGIELSRKDTPVAIKSIIEEIVCDVFEHKLSDDEIAKKIKNAKAILRKTPVRQLLVHKNLTMEINEYKVMPQHARAADYSNKHLGTKFSKENYKGGMLFVKILPNSKYPQTDVILLEPDMLLPNGIAVNYQKYEDMFIDNKLKLIFGEDYYKQSLCQNTLKKWLK